MILELISRIKFNLAVRTSLALRAELFNVVVEAKDIEIVGEGVKITAEVKWCIEVDLGLRVELFRLWR
jgi:hypothetical protein